MLQQLQVKQEQMLRLVVFLQKVLFLLIFLGNILKLDDKSTASKNELMAYGDVITNINVLVLYYHVFLCSLTPST